MLKKLRRRFVFVAMALVTTVLLFVFVALVFFNYGRLADNTRQALERALNQPGGAWHGPEIGLPGGREPGFDVLTFCVYLDAEGTLLNVGKGGVSISDDLLQAAVSQASGAEEATGTLHALSLRFLKRTDGTGTKIAFADTTRSAENLRGLVLSAFGVGGVGWLAFFAVTLLLSRQIIRPVERAWAQQRRFIADASHELKTPLTVILANIDLLLAHKEEPLHDHAQWLLNSREEAIQMKGLVEDMLFLARSDSGYEQPVLSGVSLSDAVTNCLLSFEAVAFEKGVDLRAEVVPDVRVEGDDVQLRRLAAILIDNAVKYAGSGGQVLVKLSEAGGHPVLRVENTGGVIPKEDLPHVFDRFYRADKSRGRDHGGYGLGLSIALEIAQHHKARLEVHSDEQGLTVFQAIFP